MFGALVVKNLKIGLSIATAASALVGIITVQPVSAADPDSSPPQKYHFDLTKGKGAPVCEAYLKRLNTADYTTPPYCDIPEQTTVPGFTPLHRVALTAEEAAVIGPRITMFNETGLRQGNMEEDAKYRTLQIQRGATPLDPLRGATELVRKGWKTWRYNPPMDIDNDGVADNVLVWPEFGCGHEEHTSHYDTDGRKPTTAYILVPGNDLLDLPKTKAIFGKSDGRYPIGPAIGIFKYQQLYYIETFLFNGPLNQWGFLPYSPSQSEQANTLAVFLRQRGKTQQVCEYHMTEGE